MTDRAFIDECIRSINDYRRIHQVSPLTHNAVISTTAQHWADHMTRTGSLGHNPNASYSGQTLGENCAFKWSSDRRDITGMILCRCLHAVIKHDDDYSSHGGAARNFHSEAVLCSPESLGDGSPLEAQKLKQFAEIVYRFQLKKRSKFENFREVRP